MRRVAALSRSLERGFPRAIGHRPPSGPSCSRWLSCTCCRRDSPNQSQKAPFRLGATQDTGIPPLLALQRMQMPHLPLPPPLPWSPDSAPFLRHMQILSLALLSPSEDESWEIYQALHPDLRAAIPDDVFISLLAHQLGKKKHFSRVRELLAIGKDCGMNPFALSLPTMESIVGSLLRRVQVWNYVESCADVLEWLWPTFMKLKNNSMANLTPDVRAKWLSYMMLRHKDDCQTVFAAMEDVVEQAGIEGLSPACSRILVMYHGHDPDIHRTSLRLAAWCLARDIDIREDSLRTIFHRLFSSLVRSGEDGTNGVCAAVDGLIEELTAGEAHQPAQRLREVLDWFLASQRTATEKARDLAHDPTATMPKVHRAAERVLKRKEMDGGDWEAVVGLCLRALKFKNADYEALLRIVTRRLSRETASSQHLVDLVQGILHSGILPRDTLSPQLVTRLFYALADVAGQDDAAYTLATRLYPYTRSPGREKQGQQWLEPATMRWITLFHRAVSNGHIHFASRLYADFQSDGRTVPRSAQLAFIRKIGETQSSSRRVLLDRHIKDYLWDKDVPTEPLVLELCRGLSKSPDDASMAIALCRRIQPKTPLPPLAIAALVTPLLTSARAERRNQGLALLAELPATEDARPAYHAALAALRPHVATNGINTFLHVHRAMFSNGLESDAETASLVIGALLKVDELQYAKTAFDATIASQVVLQPLPVSSLMIKLALTGKTEDAYAVHSQWCSLHATVQNTVKPDALGVVYGAKLLVDIKAGAPVDLSAYVREGTIVEHDGWKPSRPFFRWLEKVQHEHAGDATWSSVLDPVKSVESEAVEIAPEPAAAEVEVSGSPSKQPVRPMTQSFRAEPDGGLGWLDDRPQRVDMAAAQKHAVVFT